MKPGGIKLEPRIAEVKARETAHPQAELERQDNTKTVNVAQSDPEQVETRSMGMLRHVFGEIVST
ncbi:hypothetical protein VPNG_02517 [Cytospora leucostoma]|uniref:Uncharacterized protein n=1 Tax=Cytospora leucostoma TaxID=1230097 RepID=A0A423XI86_9PEZI|nr:hypothetical protein VPNG_02517 [Cytospora leucostoma]